MKSLVVSTKELSALRKKEIERVSRFVPTTFEYKVIPNLWQGVVLESDDDIDDNWLQAKVNENSYHHIHADLTEEEWREIGIRSSLWGQSGVARGQLITYGRWHEKGIYQNSHRYFSPWRELPEATIGIIHELCHAVVRFLGMDRRLVHYFFYGYLTIDTPDTSVNRWKGTPNPQAMIDMIDWTRFVDREKLEESQTKNKNSSRDPSLIYPPLRERFDWIQREWDFVHPNLPKPFLTATYRNEADQEKAFNEGRSKAHYGQSLHNYIPCYAFDIAFKRADGSLDWGWNLFEMYGALGEKCGLEWGGRYPFKDGPHLQMPMTWQEAQMSKIPALPPLPDSTFDKTRVKLLTEIVRLMRIILGR